MLLKNQWVNEETKEGFGKNQGKKKWKHNLQNLWDTAKAVVKREVHNDTGLPQERRKISNNLTYCQKELKKKKPKVSRRKEIKIREEIKMKIKKTIEEINKTKSWFF